MKRKLVILDENILAKSFAKYVKLYSCPSGGQSAFIRYLVEVYANNDQWK